MTCRTSTRTSTSRSESARPRPARRGAPGGAPRKALLVAGHVQRERRGDVAVAAALGEVTDHLVAGDDRLDPDDGQLEVVVVGTPAGHGGDRLLAGLTVDRDVAGQILAI